MVAYSKPKRSATKRIAANVKGQHAHAKPARDANHVQPDVPRADHADRLALQIEAGQLRQVHAAAAHLQDRLVHFPRQHEQERDGVLGHGILSVRGHVGNRDAAAAARLTSM